MINVFILALTKEASLLTKALLGEFLFFEMMASDILFRIIITGLILIIKTFILLFMFKGRHGLVVSTLASQGESLGIDPCYRQLFSKINTAVSLNATL